MRPQHIACVIAGIVALLAATAAFAERALLRLDGPVSDAVRGQEGLEQTFRLLTQGGSQRSGILVVVAAAAIAYRRCRRFALALPLAVLGGVVADVTLKLAVDRPRPPFPLTGTALGSFPSGHVIHAVVTFGLLPAVLLLLTGRRGAYRVAVAVSVLGIAAVAASRVYLGAHWPSDVAASIGIGSLILLGVQAAVTRRHCGGCHLHPSPA